MKFLRKSLLFAFALLIFNDCLPQGTWQTQNVSSLSWRFEDMFFLDENTGWVIDGAGQILKTENGGDSWSQQWLNPNVYFRSVEFANAQIGYAGTLAGSTPFASLFRTTDGGDNWEDITANLAGDVYGVCGMHAIDDTTIFITGVFWGAAYIMKSTNQGETWEYANIGNLVNGIVDIHFKDPMNGIAVGQSAQGTGLRAIILGTSDGGENWQQFAVGDHSNQRAWKVQYLSDDVVYVSIEEFEPSPQYFKSIDGGENWELKTVQTSNTSGTMQGIGFLNEEIGWIGGWNELFYETTDGGDTWNYLPTIGQSFNRFYRVSDTKMYSSGVNVYCYEEGATGISGIAPNQPKGHVIQALVSGDILTLSIKLVNHTYCELNIHDSQGKLIERIEAKRLGEGKHHFDHNISNLASGTYVASVYTYHGYDAVKFVVN